MNYTFKAYYQVYEGMNHEPIELRNLADKVGTALADSILIKVVNRIADKTVPQVKAFFEYGGRQVIVADLTNRGNVYIEAVEINCNTTYEDILRAASSPFGGFVDTDGDWCMTRTPEEFRNFITQIVPTQVEEFGSTPLVTAFVRFVDGLRCNWNGSCYYVR